MKAVILEGNPDCPNLVSISIYNTKSIHYLSMVSDKLKWKRVSKLVFNVNTGETALLEFLLLNQIFTDSKDMGHVDLSDQLRGTYQFDHWVRNRK